LLVLLAAPADLRMAAPASPRVIGVLAVLLLLVGVMLLAISRRPTDRLLSSVALANATSAFVLAFWLLAGWTYFSALGRLVVGVAVTGLVLLAIGELLATMAGAGPIRART
jgi:hypothetical protein